MTRRVEIPREDVTLVAVESGRDAGAPVLIFANSLGATSDMWAAQHRAFGDGYRVIGYDVRGHGRSGTPPAPYSFDDLVADAVAVMDRLEVETAQFVGLSLGGMIGLGLGLTAPERVSRLVCCAARADAPQPFIDSWDERIAAVKRGGLEAIWPATRDRWLTDGFRASNPETVAALERDFVATAPAGFIGCAEALKTLDYLRHLGRLTVPTLYVAGAEDVAAPPAAMEAMADATPGATYHCVEHAAHLVNIDAEETFDACLAGFLEH